MGGGAGGVMEATAQGKKLFARLPVCALLVLYLFPDGSWTDRPPPGLGFGFGLGLGSSPGLGPL